MKFSTSAALSTVLAATAAAAPAPTPTLRERATTISCDAWGSLQTGGYTVYHNNWGAAQATSGRQCTTFNALNGRSVSWSTSWTWAGGQNQVKSYSNVALENVGKQISAVRSIPSVWKWTNTGNNMVANVSYDLWLAASKGGSAAYEIMVWLGAYGGAGPISSTGSPVATANIAGRNWQLFKGPNGSFTVFSFVVQGGPVTNFSADMKAFIDYLVSTQGVPASYWITSLQAGTEPFTGSNAVLTTTDYSISVS